MKSAERWLPGSSGEKALLKGHYLGAYKGPYAARNYAQAPLHVKVDWAIIHDSHDDVPVAMAI